ncbi:hypothetical protein KAFR_0B00820 [Kazachstania africana CBS 2517]|uniref:Uncharacterized protein n=1 Tax=Kazachstania africana (strain ATCC 22294 / BCRC 22015 / CBS 2517 / CECT 1963 / NBRC 1671 / NRRL Y-8276) TaxID=1071382 RepID=H2APT0_KAZAF|nr:hypothetical protein KAFR_0B00820 [Kazachstania africana CBS 2517]CCF56380.1 hypothetical protein KAFR_0B00820 [Kazachstania africana CBS 2517]
MVVRKSLSKSMLDNEVPMVYATGNNEFCVALSESQGFHWNQDLFVSQYQQFYKVEYDGFIKDRRYGRSNNCVSLSYDSKNGVSNRQNPEIVEVESDTSEKNRFRGLISK